MIGKGEMIGVFLQVRLHSNRLPAKALLEMAGVPLIGHAMKALQGIDADAHALVTERDSADALRPLAAQYGFDLFVGDPEDVLDRYASAAAHYGVDTVIRATGDNPLVSGAMARRILDIHREVAADVSGFDELPLGTGVEVVSTSSLEAAAAEAQDPYEREHVTPFMFRRPLRFRIHRIPAPAAYRYSRGRVTVDTPEDFHFVREIVEDLYEGTPIEIDEVVAWLSGSREHRRVRRMA
ncbi:MAG: cytidylyltransferase domain-containing protein [Spirochaetota bacterium]